VILHARIKIITVLIAVAKSVSTPLIPTFANMAVSAAKKADSKAYTHYIKYIFSSHWKNNLNFSQFFFSFNITGEKYKETK
jgi:hypothetical protein